MTCLSTEKFEKISHLKIKIVQDGKPYHDENRLTNTCLDENRLTFSNHVSFTRQESGLLDMESRAYG